MHGPRASCARSPSLQTERDWYRASCKSALHKAMARDAKSKDGSLRRHRPWLCAAGVTRLFRPVAFKLVRGHTRAGMRASAASSTDVLSADSTLGEKKNRFLVTFCRSAKSYPLLGAEALALKRATKQKRWIPAFAGMTSSDEERHPHPNPLLRHSQGREVEARMTTNPVKLYRQ